MPDRHSDPSPTLRQLEDRVYGLARDTEATDRALDGVLQRLSDLEGKIDRMIHNLRGQIDLRDNG